MLKVALVDDHPLSFYGLKSISEKNEKKIFEVTEYFECGQDVINNIESLKIDLLLSDLQLTDISGFELLTFVKSRYPKLKVALYTAFYEKETIMKAIQLGADGIITKLVHADELTSSIVEIIEGTRFVSSGSDPFFPGNHAKRTKKIFQNISLSNREKEVLELITEGAKNKEIAIILNISVSTVEYHRKNIYQKLNVRNIAELMKKNQQYNF